MKFRSAFLIYMLLLSFVSCDKSTEGPGVIENKQINIEAIGGEYTFQLGESNWKIVGVVNNDNNVRLFGDKRKLDGEIIESNRPIFLDDLGIIESLTVYRGLQIIRENHKTLRVILSENKSVSPFSFRILLEAESGTSEFLVEQAGSKGYSFEKIEYFLDDTDRDSTYVRHNVMTYDFNHIEDKTVHIFPFAGLNELTSHFESSDPEAFMWLADTTLHVPVPVLISNDKITVTDYGNVVYGLVTNVPFKPDFQVAVNTPAGRSVFATDIEGRHRRVSYKLTMESRETGLSKEVFGKWIEVGPTGVYEIKRVE